LGTDLTGFGGTGLTGFGNQPDQLIRRLDQDEASVYPTVK
jgi:hypothetical protein